MLRVDICVTAYENLGVWRTIKDFIKAVVKTGEGRNKFYFFSGSREVNSYVNRCSEPWDFQENGSK